jgi:haloalkane dehalogenase
VANLRFVQDIPLSASHKSYATLAAIEDALPNLSGKPVLFCWGMRDWCFTPHFLARWLEYFPGALVEEYADAGHYVTENAAGRIELKIGGFLSSGLGR